MGSSNHIGQLRRLLIIPAVGLIATACGNSGLSSPGASAVVSVVPTESAPVAPTGDGF